CEAGTIGCSLLDYQINRADPRPQTFYINHVPSANAGLDQGAACASVHLDGGASSDLDDDALTYTWSEGQTTLGTGVTLDVSLSVGVHHIRLTVADSKGANATDVLTVTVQSNSPPVLSYNSSATVVAGSSITVNPASGPSDNGSINTLVVQSQG